jgi:hypothetical protein
MLQFCSTSTNAVPLCSAARRSTSVRCFRSVSIARATKVASAPRASESGLNGASIEPYGVEPDSCPRGDVGEYWPFVSP